MVKRKAPRASLLLIGTLALAAFSVGCSTGNVEIPELSALTDQLWEMSLEEETNPNAPGVALSFLASLIRLDNSVLEDLAKMDSSQAVATALVGAGWEGPSVGLQEFRSLATPAVTSILEAMAAIPYPNPQEHSGPLAAKILVTVLAGES